MNDRLDRIDRGILDALTEDSRTPLTGLARRLGVARSTVQARLARLEGNGVIAGYTIRRGANSDHDAGIDAVVSIVVRSNQIEGVIKRLGELSSIRCVHAVSGAVDLIANVRSPSPQALDDTLNRIGTIPGVHRTTSAVVLATPVDRR